jgi:signal transduction histidine kinase
MIDRTQQLERRTATREARERVLVRAPTGEDAALLAEVLGGEGHEVVPLADSAALAPELKSGAGVFLIATEALNEPDCCTSLRGILDSQEPWSELPVIVLGAGDAEEAAHVSELLGERAQLLILERPLGIRTLLTAIDSALRSRRRQYEVKRLLDELEAAAESVARIHEEADRAKDEFLATLAHELRSPIAAIQGWIQMLKAGELDPAEATLALSMIESSTKVQAHIIEDLMDVSRILAGKIMIEPSVIRLDRVVSSFVETFRPGALAKAVLLTSEIAADPMYVYADEARLQQVGWNLLSNAIKFTPQGGSIHVTLSREAQNAVLRIRDTGQGISPELLPVVFERYRQEEGSGGTAHQGLGLGLGIVKHLVEIHGGTVSAHSEGRGKGAEFVVTLPLREP